MIRRSGKKTFPFIKGPHFEYKRNLSLVVEIQKTRVSDSGKLNYLELNQVCVNTLCRHTARQIHTEDLREGFVKHLTLSQLVECGGGKWIEATNSQ